MRRAHPGGTLGQYNYYQSRAWRIAARETRRTGYVRGLKSVMGTRQKPTESQYQLCGWLLNWPRAQCVIALTSGFSASLGLLTRKYESFVASSTEKIRTSAPERNHASHRSDGTSATPMPRSAARPTADMVSSSIT